MMCLIGEIFFCGVVVPELASGSQIQLDPFPFEAQETCYKFRSFLPFYEQQGTAIHSFQGKHLAHKCSTATIRRSWVQLVSQITVTALDWLLAVPSKKLNDGSGESWRFRKP